jgi:hypothetical protein
MNEHCVRVYENVISDNTCSRLIQIIKDKKRKDNVYSLTESPIVICKVDKDLRGIAENIIKKFRQDVDLNIPRLFGPASVYLLEYPPFSCAPEHLDMTGHKEGRPNILTIVMHLNDDYEGGYLVLPNQGVTSKKKGSAVVFPASSFLHPPEVTIVTGEQSRYAVVFKIYGEPSEADNERPDPNFHL